jgi:ABC-type uncharacterized transport system substrate-binding protein
MIGRRAFITLLGGAAAWPLAGHAQQPTEKSRRIGALMMYAESDARGQSFVAAFRDGLGKLGWAEGRSLRMDYRWSTSAPASIERSAKELVALQPDLILSSSTPTTASLLQQTRTIPIIFANIVDPVGSGFIASLARPGGNVTGFLNFEFSMGGKWVELLREIAPRVNSVAALFNPTTAPYAESYLRHFRAAAQSLGIEATTVPVRDMAEVDAAIAAQAGRSNAGFMVVPDGFMVAHHAQIAAAAARYQIPAAYFFRGFADAGGLLSYGNDISDNYRRAAAYADRILKGERAGDLPVQLPVKFELVVNLKAANALSLDVPWLLQQRADEVIE